LQPALNRQAESYDTLGRCNTYANREKHSLLQISYQKYITLSIWAKWFATSTVQLFYILSIGAVQILYIFFVGPGVGENPSESQEKKHHSVAHLPGFDLVNWSHS